jgi:hypothetical protein
MPTEVGIHVFSCSVWQYVDPPAALTPRAKISHKGQRDADETPQR